MCCWWRKLLSDCEMRGESFCHLCPLLLRSNIDIFSVEKRVSYAGKKMFVSCLRAFPHVDYSLLSLHSFFFLAMFKRQIFEGTLNDDWVEGGTAKGDLVKLRVVNKLLIGVINWRSYRCRLKSWELIKSSSHRRGGIYLITEQFRGRLLVAEHGAVNTSRGKCNVIIM